MAFNILLRSLASLALVALVAPCSPSALAEGVPAFMDIVTGKGAVHPIDDLEAADEALGAGMVKPTPGPAAQKILALNDAMFGIYDANLKSFVRNLRRQNPVIIGLFNGGGGSLILFPPGKPPVVAPPVGETYRLAKSVSHSAMATFQIVATALGDPKADGSWRGRAETYLPTLRTALANLQGVDLADGERTVLRDILQRNIAFLEGCLSRNEFSYSDLDAFARNLKPLIGQTTEIAGMAQVQHWTAVLKQWRKELGPDWERTYAATNTLYVTRRNNILFTLLAQQMGKEAINTRLLLLETSAFTTQPQQMLELVTRIVADRALGKVFFSNYYLMDSELLTDGTRKAMATLAAEAGEAPMLPPLAPFLTNTWPWPTTALDGHGPSQIDWTASHEEARP